MYCIYIYRERDIYIEICDICFVNHIRVLCTFRVHIPMPPIPPFQKHKQPQSPICSKVPDVTRSPVGPFFFQLH